MTTRSFASFISVIVILFFSGCTRRPGYQSIGGWDHMMGYGGYGGMLMWLILIIFAGVIIYFVVSQSKRTDNSIDSRGESPSEILKKRYAKGEISKEEFDRIKSEIEK
ncbi:MAG: SHOCT domain-containing protein [Desulfatibacillaceae bacterium]|nr:SHOCT domain-containing protein [Desulfatibacillaceae bacterium]